MSFIQKTTESWYFKGGLLLIAFIFVSTGINGIRTSDENLLARVEGYDFTNKYFLTDVSVKFKGQIQDQSIEDLFQDSLKQFSINKLLQRFNLELKDIDLSKTGLTNDQIGKIQDMDLRDYLLDDLRNKVISTAVLYTPNNILLKELSEIAKTSIEVSEDIVEMEQDSPLKLSNLDPSSNPLSQEANIQVNNQQNITQDSYQISDQEAIAYYEQNKDLFTLPKKYVFEYGILHDNNKTEEIEDDILNATSFNEIVKKHGLKIQNGSENLYSKTINLLGEAHLEHGYISYPIEGLLDDGTKHIVHIKEIVPEKVVPFDYAQVSRILRGKKNFTNNFKTITTAIQNGDIKLLQELPLTTITTKIDINHPLFFPIIHVPMDHVITTEMEKVSNNHIQMPQHRYHFYKFNRIVSQDDITKDNVIEQDEEDEGSLDEGLALINELNQKVLEQILDGVKIKLYSKFR